MARDFIINAPASQLRILQRKAAALEKETEMDEKAATATSWRPKQLTPPPSSSTAAGASVSPSWNVLAPAFLPFSEQHACLDEVVVATSANDFAANGDGAPLRDLACACEAADVAQAVPDESFDESFDDDSFEKRLDEQAVEQCVEAPVPKVSGETVHMDELLGLLRSRVGHILLFLENNLLDEAGQTVPLKAARSVHNLLSPLGPEAPPAAEVSERIGIVAGIMNQLVAPEKKRKEEEKVKQVPCVPGAVSDNGTENEEEEVEEKQKKTSEGKKTKKGMVPHAPTDPSALGSAGLSRQFCRNPKKKNRQQLQGLSRRSDGRYVASGCIFC